MYLRQKVFSGSKAELIGRVFIYARESLSTRGVVEAE